jgi:hypothetical protein
MAVTKDDRFEVSITISVINKATGEKVTETAHTDYNLDYGSMQAFRQVAIGSLNEGTGKLGSALAESFGQSSLAQILGGVVDTVVNREPGPGVIR